MLKLRKSTNLNGDITIDNQIVVTASANITDETVGNTNVNSTVLNNELYAEHRNQCRKDLAEFKEAVYEIEDEFIDAKTIEEQLED